MKQLTLILIALIITSCSTVQLETIKAKPIYKSNTIVTEDYKELTSAIIENIDGGIVVFSFSYRGI